MVVMQFYSPWLSLRSNHRLKLANAFGVNSDCITTRNPRRLSASLLLYVAGLRATNESVP